jgi:hypothetical protein
MGATTVEAPTITSSAALVATPLIVPWMVTL